MENLCYLGVRKDMDFDDICGYSLYDIEKLYDSFVNSNPSGFWLEEKDQRYYAKKALRFFNLLFKNTNAKQLGNIIPKEYQTDIMENMRKKIAEIYEKEQKIIPEAIENSISKSNAELKKIKAGQIKQNFNYRLRKRNLKLRAKKIRNK